MNVMPIEDFFEEEETPIDNFTNTSYEENLSFNLSTKDIQVIEELSKRRNIPYRLAAQDVIRDALDLYHKFVKIMND